MTSSHQLKLGVSDKNRKMGTKTKFQEKKYSGEGTCNECGKKITFKNNKIQKHGDCINNGKYVDVEAIMEEL